jgi:FAD/FMN-containing dehydrogenase
MSTPDVRLVSATTSPVDGPAHVGSAVREFAAGLRGEVLRPGEAGYDDARRIWNGMIGRRPALIARCLDAADVVRAVGFAREHRLLVSIRGGGHNVAGTALCEGGLTIDLSAMRRVTVDPVARIARVEPGARWAEVDAETQRHGLATTGGTVSGTGVAGLTLGGGLGWLAGRYGLTCDNLLAAEVVTADGRQLRATATAHADLFWGLRGGGGNFGVVTAFEFRLHPVGPLVVAGMVAHPLERAAEVIRFYRDFVAAAPDEVNTACAMLTTPDGVRVIAVAACHCGSVEDGERALAPLKAFGPPVLDQIGVMPYVAFQGALDAAFPSGRRYYWKSAIVPALPDELGALAAEQFAAAPSPFTMLLFQQLGSAATRVAAEATAFPHRDARWDALVLAGWDDPAEDAAQVAWARRVWQSWGPFSTGVYVNGVGDDDPAEIRAAYGARYDRLAALKARYDPTNLFRVNANVRPRAGDPTR